MDAETAQIHSLYTKNRMSLRQISAIIGRDHHYIRRRLERVGIQVVKYNKPLVDRSRTCEICKAIFQAHDEHHRFCSHTCKGKAIEAGLITRQDAATYEIRICPYCEEEFSCRAKSRQKYCCRHCFELHHSKRMTGKANPSYKDGSSYSKPSFRGEDWDAIRQRIYQRDRYTCQDCGSKCIGKDAATPETTHLIIQCHHIQPYQSPEDNADNNLVTLCIRCHIARHNPNPNTR